MYYYISRTSPRNKTIKLKCGLEIILSGHYADIITIFVIFIKEDYGKVEPRSIVLDVGAIPVEYAVIL